MREHDPVNILPPRPDEVQFFHRFQQVPPRGRPLKMLPSLHQLLALCLTLCTLPLAAQATLDDGYARDQKQKLDEDYTRLIAKYTTDPSFLSPLTNYLPASDSVPTPAKVLGDIAGAPGMLPYAEDVYKYFRQLEASTKRVKVFSIGRTEEGREMIAVAVGDESLITHMDENRARLALLADPRLIHQDDEKAKALISQSYPVYYITGTIHSTETGAPTALMELAYRLAVDDAPYIQYIRTHTVTLITPVVEVDGRDRMVDIYKWHIAHPGQNWPRLLYWGHYVAHDNNRDAMAMTLNLTNNILGEYLTEHAQVLHDLHESVPFLYDNTVGDGPYNAWIDPLLADEWAMLGWNNVAQMQSFGMPGVFTHGDFDTWSPGYLMFLAGMHNGISRLYETFGNGGADTEKRILDQDEYSRTWFRQNPPLPVVLWSQRDNNNYEQTALLTTLNFFAHNSRHFLDNYYLKAKRSIAKPTEEGPTAYILPADEGGANRQAQLLRVLLAQHVELSRLSEPYSLPGVKAAPPKPEVKAETFSAGSYVVRMDQPFSRAADALLDRQYWSPDDPQRHPYDDTGWSFGDLFHSRAVRVVNPSILKSRMEPVREVGGGKADGSGSLYAIPNTGQITLLSLRFALKDAQISINESAFTDGGRDYPAGSLILEKLDQNKLTDALKHLDLEAHALHASPSARMHPAALPRIAFMHTWLSTQSEGWWRVAFDKLGIPFDYISTQTAAREQDLRAKYDVILFIGTGSDSEIINGLPFSPNSLPWQNTELTPNIGKLDSTPDMRPGLSYAGVAHLQAFVQAGGLLVTSGDSARLAIDTGMAPGVFLAPAKDLKVVGSVLHLMPVDKENPSSYGMDADFAGLSPSGMAFTISNLTLAGRDAERDKEPKRVTGRGGADEQDTPEGRAAVEPEILPTPKPWQAAPLNEEQQRNNPRVLPAALRPAVVARFSDTKSLLLSGLLENGGAIAERPAVVDAHLGSGNVLLFAINPVYRGETIGTYPLVLNAILNFDHLANPTPALPAGTK
jgi:hypothetical protein